jgi:hypothetical protein
MSSPGRPPPGLGESDDPRRLAELFATLRPLDETARARRLAEIGAGDGELAAELGRLLAEAERRGEDWPLDRAPWRELGAAASTLAASPPSRIGPYRVERLLGRGGMGLVYLAQQEGEGFARPVALKVVVPGGAGAEVERRFREERRILAGLEHPGIARFYDAGRAADGTWFLALEYVEGEDLLAFVRGRRLDLRDRVALFLEVLDAVDFAHRRLVVHRDLKPANVLVGADGRARLLDFGISKIVDPDEDALSTATRTEHRAFTPAYASPEQLRGEPAAVAADVYSLGVMLYEILAGRRPFDRRPGALGELAGGARGRVPEPPSRVARGLVPEVEEAAEIRWRELRGDLDAIALKALRPEAESRYPSAAAFAQDLRRWLAGEPVEARRGGRRYRLAKFAGRHRLALAAAAGIVAALTAGLSVALVQRAQAVEARARAEATVADLHRLTQAMLFEIYAGVRRLPGSLAVSGTIVRRATEVLDRLAATAGGDRRMLADLAAGYGQLGLMFGQHPALGRSLRQPRAAVDFLERAVALRARLAEAPGATFADRLEHGKSLGALAIALGRAGDAAGSERSAAEGLRLLEALAGEAPDRGYLHYLQAVAHGRARMSVIAATTRASPGDPHFAAAARLWREFAAAPPPAALADPDFPGEVWLAIVILLDAGDGETALRVSDLGLLALARLDRDEPDAALAAGRRANLLIHRAAVLEQFGRPAEALADFKELLRLRAASPPDPDDLLPDAIRRLSETLKAAELAGRAGDFDFAAACLADVERLLVETEARFGAPAFEPLRLELERIQGDLLWRRAEVGPGGGERRRLLAAALASYDGALVRAQRLGGAGTIHGIAAETLVELRRHRAELAAALRR